jgi:hypothetical protein
MRFFRIAATISSNVKSGCSTISPNKNSAFLRRRSAAATRHGRNAAGFFQPLRQNHHHTRAEFVSVGRLTARHTGLDGFDYSARKSLEYGLGLDCPLRIESMPPHSLVDKPLGIPPIQPDRNML